VVRPRYEAGETLPPALSGLLLPEPLEPGLTALNSCLTSGVRSWASIAAARQDGRTDGRWLDREPGAGRRDGVDDKPL